MKRLAVHDINTPQEYDRIFLERLGKPIDSFDFKRWFALVKHFKKGIVIDIGCLDSIIAKILLPKLLNGSRYVGIDVSTTAMKYQRRYWRGMPNVTFDVANAYNLSYGSNYFDYAILGEILEHLEEPEKAIEEAFRILKPGGILAISVPFNEAREPGAVDGERHLWSYTLSDFEKMTHNYGKMIDYKILGSAGVIRLFGRTFHLPWYKYHFPNLLIWVKKHGS